jgi:hypothetical protein
MSLQSTAVAGATRAPRFPRLLPAYALIRRACECPAAPWLAVLATVLLTSASIGVGQLADDYIQRLILTGSAELSGYHVHWTRLFQLATPDLNQALMRDGVLAWWADPELRFTFFRPLAALTHRIDYALWPQSTALMHLHSMLWAVLAVLAAGQLFRVVFKGAWFAVLALVFYAVDPTRAIAIAWIANRNALIACALSLFAVVLFVRGLRGDARARIWSPVLFAVALTSSEGAFGAAGYLLAAALFLDRGPLRARLLKLAPHALLAGTVALTSRALGFGVVNSGVYFDPLRDTAAFLSALPLRAAVLLAAAAGGPPSDYSNAYDLMWPGLSALVLALNVLGFAFWLRVLWPLLRRSETARFCATGMLVALLPAAAAFPSDRLLGWVAVGACGLFAEFFAGYVAGRERRAKLVAFAAFMIVFARLVAAPPVLVAQCAAVARGRALIERTSAAVPGNREVRDKTVVYVNPPQDPQVVFVPAMRAALGVPRPLAQRWLATGLSAVAVRRVGPRSLEVTQDQGFLRQQTEQLVRSPRHPLHLGERIVLPQLTAQVEALTRDQRPERVRFDFDAELEADRFIWRAFVGGTYVAFTPPKLGECVVLPGHDLAELVLGRGNPLSKLFAALRAEHAQPRRDLCGAARD